MVINRTDYVASLVKGLSVIECFSAEESKLSATQVAGTANLDRAAARRYLMTLVEAGYAEFDGKFYTLTPRVLRLGVSALSTMALPRIVQPWIDQLSAKLGESVSVSIRDGDSIVYIARAAQTRVISIGLMPGSRLPVHCTAMGRVLLAGMGEGDRSRLLSQLDLTPRTPFSITDPAALERELSQVATCGFAIVDQELEVGLRSISVPLKNSRNKIVAALNVGVAAIQNDPSDLQSLYLADLLTFHSGIQRILS